jgi:predicted TPR repeat methyltransferase
MSDCDPIEDPLRVASRHCANGELDQARAILRSLSTPTSFVGRTAFLQLHRNLGTPRPEDEEQLNAELSPLPKSADEAFNRAQSLLLLNRPEALEAAELAVSLNGTADGPILLLLKIHLDADRPDAAYTATIEAADRREAPGGLLLAVAKIFGQRGHTDHAIRLLDAARPHQQDNQAEFDFVAAGINGTLPAGSSQADMAETIFNKFAVDYDQVLTDIGYRVPDIIREILDTLPLRKMKRLQVLDAGCGTGLCAKILRPYAKSLQGADISVPMLEKAKKKRIYNGLTRTDLNIAASFPAGSFDLIVAADVLIYFGDLTAVLASLSQTLAPGGWLLLTVENGGELGAPGYILGASGRYKHSEAHVSAALSASGLGHPKHMLHRTLRHEFGIAVEGLAIAAQKPILAF